MHQLKQLINARAEAAITHATNRGFNAGRNAISIQDKILTSIRWELVFTLISGLACIAGIFASESLPVLVFLVLLLTYITFFTVYLIRIYSKTKNKVLSNGTIRSSISDTIVIIKDFILLYTRLSMSFVPAVFVAAFLAGLLEFLENENSPSPFPWFSLFIGAVIAGGWIILMKLFTRWWMYRLYGNHLRNLEADLEELDNEN